MELGSGKTFNTSLSPFPLPSQPPGLAGAWGVSGGSWQLLGGVSWHSLTLLPGPSEEVAVAEAAVKSAAAPALGVYIFFTQSSGIVHLFFKAQRGEEPCIICKHCIIGYVVQSLLYSSSCQNIHRYAMPLPPPKGVMVTMPPPCSAASLQLLAAPLQPRLPAAPWEPLLSLL